MPCGSCISLPLLSRSRQRSGPCNTQGTGRSCDPPLPFKWMLPFGVLGNRFGIFIFLLLQQPVRCLSLPSPGSASARQSCEAPLRPASPRGSGRPSLPPKASRNGGTLSLYSGEDWHSHDRVCGPGGPRRARQCGRSLKGLSTPSREQFLFVCAELVDEVLGECRPRPVKHQLLALPLGGHPRGIQFVQQCTNRDHRATLRRDSERGD